MPSVKFVCLKELALDKEKYAKVLELLSSGHLKSLNFEKLRGHSDLYSIRVDRETRLLLVRESRGDTCYFVVVELVPHHRYDKSKYLNNTRKLNALVNSQDLESHFEPISEEEQEQLPLSELSTLGNDSVVRYFDGHFLSFNAKQDEASTLTTPAIVCGPPGTGKTAVAEDRLRACYNELRARKEKGRIAYVTCSKPLAEQRARQWSLHPDYDPESGELVSFVTYDELLKELPSFPKEATLVDESNFTTWFGSLLNRPGFKSKWQSADSSLLSLESAGKIYQELRLLSGYPNEHDYLTLGNKQSTLSVESGARSVIVDIFKQYSAALGTQFVDLSFYAAKDEDQYLAIVVDEGQQLSLNQHLVLTRLCGGRIVIFLDFGQSFNDVISPLDFLAQRLKCVPLQLPMTYRCSRAVLELVNKITTLNHALAGGVADKYQHLPAQTADVAVPGSVSWITDTSASWLKSSIDGIYVLITAAEQLQRVKQNYPGCVVLSYEQSLGLEFDNVVIISPFDTPAFKEANKASIDWDNLKPRIHRAKRGQSYTGLQTSFNRLVVGASRCRDNLYLVQSVSHDNEHLLTYFKGQQPERKKSTSAQPPAFSQERERDEWRKLYEQFLEGGHTQQADEVARVHGFRQPESMTAEPLPIPAALTVPQPALSVPKQSTPAPRAKQPSAGAKKMYPATPLVKKSQALKPKTFLTEKFLIDGIQGLEALPQEWMGKVDSRYDVLLEINVLQAALEQKPKRFASNFKFIIKWLFDAQSFSGQLLLHQFLKSTKREVKSLFNKELPNGFLMEVVPVGKNKTRILDILTTTPIGWSFLSDLLLMHPRYIKNLSFGSLVCAGADGLHFMVRLLNQANKEHRLKSNEETILDVFLKSLTSKPSGPLAVDDNLYRLLFGPGTTTNYFSELIQTQPGRSALLSLIKNMPNAFAKITAEAFYGQLTGDILDYTSLFFQLLITNSYIEFMALVRANPNIKEGFNSSILLATVRIFNYPQTVFSYLCMKKETINFLAALTKTNQKMMLNMTWDHLKANPSDKEPYPLLTLVNTEAGMSVLTTIFKQNTHLLQQEVPLTMFRSREDYCKIMDVLFENPEGQKWVCSLFRNKANASLIEWLDTDMLFDYHDSGLLLARLLTAELPILELIYSQRPKMFVQVNRHHIREGLTKHSMVIYPHSIRFLASLLKDNKAVSSALVFKEDFEPVIDLLRKVESEALVQLVEAIRPHNEALAQELTKHVLPGEPVAKLRTSLQFFPTHQEVSLEQVLDASNTPLMN